ncbi:MAG: hypothetical protein AVDCRST_MAG47-2802, partial [uncultured Nocardioidaceae bacterium]
GRPRPGGSRLGRRVRPARVAGGRGGHVDRRHQPRHRGTGLRHAEQPVGSHSRVRPAGQRPGVPALGARGEVARRRAPGLAAGGGPAARVRRPPHAGRPGHGHRGRARPGRRTPVGEGRRRTVEPLHRRHPTL